MKFTKNKQTFKRDVSFARMKHTSFFVGVIAILKANSRSPNPAAVILHERFPQQNVEVIEMEPEARG